MGGFTPPSIEGQVAELKESFRLWQQVTASGADTAITESSWWMARITDPHGRASMPETLATTTQLSAFAVGVLGQLLNSGAIQWANPEMKLPDLEVEAQGFTVPPTTKLTEDEEIDVARLLKDLDDE